MANMEMPPVDKYISFARRHFSPSLSTFDASTALFRAERLVADIKEVDDLIRLAKANGQTKGRQQYWLEIISYYSVGLVTCLEWHARSRLTDLFNFRPEIIESDDLTKGKIKDKLLSQMVAERISIPQLLGAMRTIGSSQEYISCFERVFEALGTPLSPRDVLNPMIIISGEGDVLQELFEYRNTLVHEIDYSQVGPWTVRDNLNIDAALRYGKLVVNVMRALENVITSSAPNEFPNRLNASGSPIDKLQVLDEQISLLEEKINTAIQGLCDSDSAVYGLTFSRWTDALNLSREAVRKESDFIDEARFINTRHYDFKKPILIELRRLRLEYLKILSGEL